MKRIPIKVAKELAEKLGQSTVVIITWEGESSPTPTGRTHVVTYGRSQRDCEWAAVLGNRIKRNVLGWPEEMCQAVPTRVKKLKSPPSEPQCNCQDCKEAYEWTEQIRKRVGPTR